VSERPYELDENSEYIVVESKVLSVEPRFARDTLKLGDLPFQKLPHEELEATLKGEAESGVVRTVSSPKLVVESVQLSHVMVINQAAYIQDHEMVREGEGYELKPRIGVSTTGQVIKVRPAMEGDSVEIREFDAQISQTLGARVCQARVESRDSSWGVVWEEPVILSARPDPELPELLTFGADETLIIPMRYRVLQSTASVRAYAVPDSIREKYSPSLALEEDYSSPLNLQHVLLLSVRPLSEEERKEMLEENNKAG
jgi:hypothetical protein